MRMALHYGAVVDLSGTTDFSFAAHSLVLLLFQCIQSLSSSFTYRCIDSHTKVTNKFILHKSLLVIIRERYKTTGTELCRQVICYQVAFHVGVF